MIQEVRKVSTPEIPPGTGVVPTTTAPARTPRVTITSANLRLEGEDRQRLIAETAYFLAERRGFQPGRELEDWLAAEIEVDALLGEDDSHA